MGPAVGSRPWDLLGPRPLGDGRALRERKGHLGFPALAVLPGHETK